MKKTMKAVVLDRITPAEEIKLTEVPIPAGKPGWALCSGAESAPRAGDAPINAPQNTD